MNNEELLVKQQDMFKEQVDELYFIQKKAEERIKEFTAKQVELLEKAEEHLRVIKTEMSDSIKEESARFKKIRKVIEEDISLNKFRRYGLYGLYIIVLAVSLMNMWVIYRDSTRRPGELYALYQHTVKGKQVIIEAESIKKKEINGKEYTFATVKQLM